MKRLALALLGAAALSAAPALAQDLTISEIGVSNNYQHWGSASGKAAYSFATTSCNVGNVPVLWNDLIDQAPVIGQNLFRVVDGRIEQLGYSWLKYGFCAVNEFSCGNCQMTDCDTLGVGCADTYGAGLNDGENGGAKFEINANTGTQPHNFTQPSGSLPLRGRLQVELTEMAQGGSIYIAEAQYVSEHDQMAGNSRNNVSWRHINVAAVNNLTNAGPTMVGDPAIYAWEAMDGATVVEAPLLHEGGADIHGWFFVGYKTTPLGAGLWRYEYAVQNVTSDRSAGSFALPVDCASVQITDVTFRDVNSHSGEIWDSTDWTFSETGREIRWATVPFATDSQANALRWGTLYNFGFTANRSPHAGVAEIGIFKPGTPSALFVDVEAPCGTPICGAQSYCVSNRNSASSGALMGSAGSTSITTNDLTLQATAAAINKSGLFFYGTSQIQAPFGDGFRCTGGSIFRLQPILTTNAFGDAQRALDFTTGSLSSGPGMATPGGTLNFQFWFRDPAGPGGGGFNLTDGLSVTFCP